MPYNNTPIAPPQENQYTGETKLPLARVKKIIASDDDISACSATAAFAMTIATEMFIQHLVAATHGAVRAEKRPRRNILYRDVAAAVAKHDSLEFLADVVPRQTSYRTYLAKRGRVADGRAAAGPPSREGEPLLQTGTDGEAMDVDAEGDANGTEAVAAAANANGVLLESPKGTRAGAGTVFDVVSEEVMAPEGE